MQTRFDSNDANMMVTAFYSAIETYKKCRDDCRQMPGHERLEAQFQSQIIDCERFIAAIEGCESVVANVS